MSLLMWSAYVVCHMSLLMWSADVDIPDLMVIVCSLDPMVLIHFGFSTLWSSGLSNLKLKNLEVRFFRSLNLLVSLEPKLNVVRLIMILDRQLDLSAALPWIKCTTLLALSYPSTLMIQRLTKIWIIEFSNLVLSFILSFHLM
jgi:hypothetical protein